MSGTARTPPRGFAMPVPAAGPVPPNGTTGTAGDAGGAGDVGGAGDAGAARPLPDDALVEIGAERRQASIDAVLGRLDRELVGLAPVKTRVREIAALLLVDRLRR